MAKDRKPTRKRAPGGGRKPQGEYAERTAQFTMRMSKELRAGLEREAKRSQRSLSQEVEHRLRGSLAMPKHFVTEDMAAVAKMAADEAIKHYRANAYGTSSGGTLSSGQGSGLSSLYGQGYSSFGK